VASRLPHRTDGGEKFVPRLGQDQRLADPFEKRDTQIGLKPRNLAAERRLGQAQHAGGGRKRAFLYRGKEGPDLIPVEGDGTPIHASMHKLPTILCNFF